MFCTAALRRAVLVHAKTNCRHFTTSQRIAAPVRSVVQNKKKTGSASKWIVATFAGGAGGYCGYTIATHEPTEFDSALVVFFKTLPLRYISRLWGNVNNWELPSWMRSPVFRLYIWMFSCKMEEAVIQDLQHYKNLGELFRRRIKANVRPIDQIHAVTSPSDGKVLNFGEIRDGFVEQVKGITYPIQSFIGPQSWQELETARQNGRNKIIMSTATKTSNTDYENSIKKSTQNKLYHCVIYLAPGDYHGFHSPSDWVVTFRRHFPGNLMSVSPFLVGWIRGLFTLNERAVYVGSWKHGFFSMAAIGATNVGSIKVYSDKTLTTNTADQYPQGAFFDETFASTDLAGIQMKKGESFGEFNLGSTIVLIFEAPENFKFSLEFGQKIKFGEPIGNSK